MQFYYSTPGMWNRTQKPPVEDIVDLAQPSLTHMAIKTLLNKQILKYLVSQNTDGMHIRSGVDPQLISELHGNRNCQKCINCNTHYYRDFRTLMFPRGSDSKSHLTSRKCQNCNGDLQDTIVYFGEKLPKQQLSKAFEQALKSDLCICLGSSLTVKPSSNVPLIVREKNGHLCIVNIQQTPLDKMCSIKINDFSDRIMSILMRQLRIEIDDYCICHFLEFTLKNDEIEVKGRDKNGKRFSFINKVKYMHNGEEKEMNVQNGNQFCIPLSEKFDIIFFPSSRNKQTIKKPLKIVFSEILKLTEGSNANLLVKAQLVNKQWKLSTHKF